MEFEHILVQRSGDFATVTMNRPQRRNALSLEHMRELIAAFLDLGGSHVLGIVLAGNGPVFSAGHYFADVAGADLPAVRTLLLTCTELMTLMQHGPLPVAASATAALQSAAHTPPRAGPTRARLPPPEKAPALPWKSPRRPGAAAARRASPTGLPRVGAERPAVPLRILDREVPRAVVGVVQV